MVEFQLMLLQIILFSFIINDKSRKLIWLFCWTLKVNCKFLSCELKMFKSFRLFLIYGDQIWSVSIKWISFQRRQCLERKIRDSFTHYGMMVNAWLSLLADILVTGANILQRQYESFMVYRNISVHCIVKWNKTIYT